MELGPARWALTRSFRMSFCLRPKSHQSIRSLAGHSHYHNIKHRKAAVDAKRQAQFQKLSNDICSAITAGGNNPNENSRLARAIEVARKAGLPNKRIENALAPSALDAADVPTAVYFGVFPHGIVVRVTATQARPRAIAAELRALFRRAGGDLEKAGWQFRDLYDVIIQEEFDDKSTVNGKARNADFIESVTLIAMDLDITDIIEDADGTLRLVCKSATHAKSVRDSLKETFPELAHTFFSVHTVQPLSFITVQDEPLQKSTNTLLEKLDAHRDVIDVVHNMHREMVVNPTN